MQPTGELIDVRHLESLHKLSIACQTAGVELNIFRASGSSLISQVRSTLATNFIDAAPDDSVLLWADSDQTFEGEAAVQMCRSALVLDAVVGAPVSTKAPGGRLNLKTFPGTKQIMFGKEGALIPVIGVGCGLCAVSGEVLKHLASGMKRVSARGEEIFPLYRDEIVDGVWWGEDMNFCRLAALEGFSILCDTRARVGHRGFYTYDVEDVVNVRPSHESLLIKLES